MRKIYLSVIGFSIICRLNVHAQTRPDTLPKLTAPISLYKPVEQDTASTYNPRALQIEEINLVSSYYTQKFNHSSVTGDNPNFLGTGVFTNSGNVTDFSNGLDLKLGWIGDNKNKNSLDFGFGVDHHTSASAAFVSKTGASKTGGSRIYPSFDWTVENGKTGNTFGIGTYYSGEYNYKSLGADLHFSLKTHDKSGEFTAKLQGYFDHVTLIYPSELIPPPINTGTIITSASGTTSGGGYQKPKIPTSPRNTYTAAFSYSQMINSRLQVMFLGDVVAQNGYLSLPFHRVYFNAPNDTTHKIEKLPSSRFKLPLGVRLNYFLGDNIILRSYYRYYTDDWGTKSNTIGLEVPYKITPFFSISPFYRYYDQTASKYFAPFKGHDLTDQYYTSNYEYAKFQSQFYGIGFRLAPPKGVFGWQNLHDLEIRYGHYTQTTNLVSDVISLNLGFK